MRESSEELREEVGVRESGEELREEVGVREGLVRSLGRRLV